MDQVETEEVNAVHEGEHIDDDNYPVRNNMAPNYVDNEPIEFNDGNVDVDEEIDDESSGNDEEFSDRESSICSLDRELENVNLSSDSESSISDV